MPRQLFTAVDIQRIGREQKCDLLVLGPDDIITPEAVDVARELGVRIIRENSPNFPRISEIPSSPMGPPIPLPPLKLVLGGSVILDPFGEGLATPGTNVRLKDVVTSLDGSTMATGYMTLEQGVFPWKLSYDEIDIVIDGELIITRDNVAVHGKPGDIIFIPKGSSITFSTPSKVRFVYVAFPANWNELG